SIVIIHSTGFQSNHNKENTKKAIINIKIIHKHCQQILYNSSCQKIIAVVAAKNHNSCCVFTE
ncbi:hypothetical protein KA405_05980, partial [Patescibacteria group bacterium]|nr:hypothetical protein [Patescibacteria group bacterium]